MDGDALIRRWLAQQHELGDRELILPSLTAREAGALVHGGRTAGSPTSPVTPPERSAPSPTAVPAADRPRVAARAPDVAAPQQASASPVADGADWRTELSAAGAAPRSAGRTRPAGAKSAQPAHATDPDTLPLTAALDLSGAQSIEALAGLIAQCRACSLVRTAHNPVPGEGNPNADFVCVGEAPGESEDQQGRPFVGRAGQLLTKILSAVNLEREDVFIMNVLKHRPPGNRNPDPVEVAACRPFLLRQLELIQPKVILALGTFAAQTLLDTKESLGKLRGRVHSFQGIPVVVTYHPAALLRNSAWKRPTWEDVQLARRILDGTGPGA